MFMQGLWKTALIFFVLFVLVAFAAGIVTGWFL